MSSESIRIGGRFLGRHAEFSFSLPVEAFEQKTSCYLTGSYSRWLATKEVVQSVAGTYKLSPLFSHVYNNSRSSDWHRIAGEWVRTRPRSTREMRTDLGAV